MASLRIFVSFEFEKDNSLKSSFYEPAKEHAQYRALNCSLNKEYPDEAWKKKAREAIRESDVVFVLVGQNTHNAPGVLTETDMARNLDKPTIQILSDKARRNNYSGGPPPQRPYSMEVGYHQREAGRTLGGSRATMCRRSVG